MYLEMKEEELYNENGLLRQLMETAFDASVLINKDGLIIHRTKGSKKLTESMIKDEAIGKSIHILDPQSPFDQVLATGKSRMGLLVVINQRKCMTNLLPIKCNNKTIGVLGVVLFQNMNKLKEILFTLNNQVENTKIEDNFYHIVSRVSSNYTFDDFIGKSQSILDMIEYCRRAATTPYSVLITGETGTGKEIIASGFQSANLDRNFAPFVKINCSAIPKELIESELFGHEKGAFTGALTSKVGKFELAAGGTILLDEIGEMDMMLQSKLLRVIEEREFEKVGGNTLLPMKARIIASTNQNLREQIEKGLFRKDLYYRLNTIEITIPPLRSRPEDIPLLLDYFIDKKEYDFNFSNEVIEILKEYNWPGNVRELRNFIDKISLIKKSQVIEPSDLKHIPGFEHFENKLPMEKLSPLDYNEKKIIKRQLETDGFNISKAAKNLGMCRATLYDRIKKYGIKY